MGSYAVVATVQAKPGKRDEVLQAMRGHRDRSLADEPGTEQFDLLVPLHEEDKILIFECYADKDAFKAHAGGPSMAQVGKEIDGLVENMIVERCNVDGR
ncbi:MAG: putative quinol monooxygenase [Alphaproteobacteria bacterium]|jgi:quinol monooxygenase YgiN|nr:antibiotic biosynthesis monooxygenase [Rhodospirillaceae bacterium]MDP6406185.1 putative quinol monooxygenase [Alphaproteobacteria bacterium]MDP6621247.1 putative quinol monooxygenase [Alphaproteobacteria bacterium]HJP22640.1 putative quinol monooxygenase [Alphaproteobacteria bacterium]|tara:strand:+ start:1434 stop:1730 length:297 start_codon:yes stop_codon:yes gene_type:complete